MSAPQENDAKFRFAIHPQGIRQFHDNAGGFSWAMFLYNGINISNMFIFMSYNYQH